MRRSPALALFALAWALACGPAEEAPTPPAPRAPMPPSQPEPPAPPPAPEPAPAPPATPEPGDATSGGDIAAGEALYATYCASCHGARGEGDGPVATSLDPAPAKHSDAAYMDTLSDEHLFAVIKSGGPAVGKSPLMVPWGGTLSDEQIRDVVAFTRSLSQ